MLVTDRDVPFTNSESERAPRTGVIHSKLTSGQRLQSGADLFGALRSVIGTDALNDLSPFEAIAASLDGKSIFNLV